MSLPAKYDFPAQQRGADFFGVKFQLFDKNDIALDLTDCTVKMQLRKTPISDVVDLEFSTEDATIEVEANEVFVKPRSGNNITLEAYKYNYDILLIYADGVRIPIVKGLWDIENNVTR